MARLDEDRPVGVGRTSLYLPELEALRGWAILLVFVFHLDGYVAMLGKRGATPGPALAFVWAGHTGVSLFFVLSAFLLSLPYLDEAAGGRRVSRTRYAARRALRILPLYYSAVIAATLLSAGQLADLLRGLPYLVFLNSFAEWFTPLPPYSNVWWSLATEAQFYCLLPLLPLGLRSRAGRALALLLLLLYAAAYGAFLLGALRMSTIPGQIRLGNSLFGRAPLFMFGIAAAALYRHHGAAIRARLSGTPILRYGGADALLGGLLLALGMMLRWVIVFGPARAETPPFHAWHIAEGALWSAIVLLVLLAPLRAKRLVSNRPSIALGVLSYSIFMWHIPVVFRGFEALRDSGIAGLVGWTARSAVLAAVLTVVCLAASALTYRWIERPFLVRKERLAAG